MRRNLSQYIYILTQILPVYSYFYKSEEKEIAITIFSNDTDDASKPFQTASLVECILKCQEDFKLGFHDAEKGQCSCLTDKAQKIVSNEELKGILYEPFLRGVG